MARYYQHSTKTFQPENLFRVNIESDSGYKIICEDYKDPNAQRESGYSYYKIVRLLDSRGCQLVENYVGQYGLFEWVLFTKNDDTYFVYGSSTHLCIHNLTKSRHSTFELGGAICDVIFSPDKNKVLILVGSFGSSPDWLLYNSTDLNKGLGRLGTTPLPCNATKVRWLDDHRIHFKCDGDYSFHFLRSEEHLNADEQNIHYSYLRNLSVAKGSPTSTFIEREADGCCFLESKIWDMNAHTIEWCNWPFQIQKNEVKLRLLYYRYAEYDRQQGDSSKKLDRKTKCRYRDHVVSLHNVRAFLTKKPLTPMSKQQQILFESHKEQICRHRDDNLRLKIVDPLRIF